MGLQYSIKTNICTKSHKKTHIILKKDRQPYLTFSFVICGVNQLYSVLMATYLYKDSKNVQ